MNKNRNVEEKNQNAISEKKSPSDSIKPVESKMEIEQNENIYKECEFECNKEIQSILNGEKKGIIQSTKLYDIKPKKKKNKGNKVNNNIVVNKIEFLSEEEARIIRKQPKNKKVSKPYKKRIHRRVRGHIKIFNILNKLKNKIKEIILSINPLKVKMKIMHGLLSVQTRSSFISNGPPTFKKKKLNIRKSSLRILIIKNRFFSSKTYEIFIGNSITSLFSFILLFQNVLGDDNDNNDDGYDNNNNDDNGDDGDNGGGNGDGGDDGDDDDGGDDDGGDDDDDDEDEDDGDDEKLKEKDYKVIRNICTNHDKNEKL